MSSEPTFCFPRSARLLAKASFDAAFADGRRCGSHYFRASITNAPTEVARVGLAVSRRVSKRAVDRNRIKRCVRESFRHHRASLPPFDVVVTAKHEAAVADLEALRRDLVRLWQRVAALKPAVANGTMRGAV